MPRTVYPSIQEITQQILREVQAENHVKLAEQQLLQQALAPQIHTDIAQQLCKVAALCRQLPTSPAISYNDLHHFMEQAHER